MSGPASEHPHRRYNPLTGQRILVSPHRTLRPWQGQREDAATEQRPAYDPQCYEMLGEPQRDLTPEQAAGRLREMSEVHYRLESHP